MRQRCGASSRPRYGLAGRVRHGETCPATWATGPASITASGAGRCAAGGSWCSRRCARLCPRTGWCCWTARRARRNAPPRVLRAATPRRSASAAAAAGCARSCTPARTARAASCGSCQAPASTPTCAMPQPSSQASPRATQHSTAATCRPSCAPRSRPRAAPSTPRPSSAWWTRRPGTRRSTPAATTSRTCSRS